MIDEAPFTGESTPKRKGVAANVFAGTVNLDAVLRVRVTSEAKDNTIARVVRLVEMAQESKAPTARFIERFSKYYTPTILVLATLVALVPPLLMGANWNEWIYKGLAILLIGCPCALVISTPAAIAAGLSNGAKRGLLMKGGAVLEGFKNITTVCFDKTGTLTEGRPKVTEIIGLSSSQSKVLSLAAADIGIAMGGGTDVALETADTAALHGRVNDIANMVDLSKRKIGNIWQNIALSLGLKGVFCHHNHGYNRPMASYPCRHWRDSVRHAKCFEVAFS